MPDKYYGLTNDVLFKLTFGHPKRTRVLTCLINALLGLQDKKTITEVEILNPFNDKDFIGDKLSIVDIKAKDREGVHYNIEMQVQLPLDWVKRSLYYASKLYSSQLEDASPYKSLNKTISISLLGGVFFPAYEELHNHYAFHNIRTLDYLSDLIELHFIELAKFKQTKPPLLCSPFEKWLYALKFGDHFKKESDMIPKELLSEDGIEEALNTMQYANSDAHIRDLMESRQKAIHDQASREYFAREEGIAEGIEKGKAEGKAEGIAEGKTEGNIEGKAESQLEIARNLLDILDDEIIAKKTGLDLDTVRQLRNGLK